MQRTIEQQIFVKNAGLILLNSYFGMLFERLQLVSNKEFTTFENQLKAAQYLQYVATGLTHTEEINLPLNKVICGLPITQSIPEELEITAESKQLIEGLINAAIGYWPAIGSCSVDGFRGNWLVRDGLLTESEDRWELTVEKRAYDILISKSPFSFSIVKHHWMEKPLHTNWSF